jgi:DNA-binding GntR family transcriptional regulator
VASPDQAWALAHLAPVVQRRTADEVADRLRDVILSGACPPGEHLREMHLAETLGVPRGSVREALLLLESEGLVERRLHRGAVVRAIAPETLEEVFTLRLALERVAAEFAARRRTPEDVERLRALLEGLRADADGEPDIRRDIAFHDELVRIARHERLQVAWRGLHSQLRLLIRQVGNYSPAVRYADHERIVEAVAAGDAERAVAEISHHIEGAYERALTLLPPPTA